MRIDAPIRHCISDPKDHKRDLNKQLSKKENQMYFDMKAQVGAHAESCLVNAAGGTSSNVCDLAESGCLLRGHVK